MTNRKEFPKPFRDIEKPYETVAESFSDEGLGVELLTVRLRGLWSELIHAPDAKHEADAQPRSPSAVPLLDDMKGIRQWD
jgi:hypothetical protein